MANTSSAKKALRQTVKLTARNLAKKKKIKELMKEAEAAIESKSKDAQAAAHKLYKALDKAAKTNTIHKNKASRLKSTVQQKINKIT